MKKEIMMAFLLTLVFSSVAVYGEGSSTGGNSPTNSNADGEVDIYACEVSEDCVLESLDGCCEQVSVNRNYRDQVDSKNFICAAVCFTEAVCEEGKCSIRNTKINETNKTTGNDFQYGGKI